MRISKATRILGIKAPFTAKQAQQAYRRLAMVNHPDKGGSADTMAMINKAYRLCSKGVALGSAPTITVDGVDISQWFKAMKKKGPSFRGIVAWFSQLMYNDLTLLFHTWKDMKSYKLYLKMHNKMRALDIELHRENLNKQEIINQCVDVASLAMIMADNARRKL